MKQNHRIIDTLFPTHADMYTIGDTHGRRLLATLVQEMMDHLKEETKSLIA